MHIPLPVELDAESIAKLKAADLRPVFSRGSGRLLIWGEGGSGKTSLACQIARWSMEEMRSERPSANIMIPVLIERELDFEVEDQDPFLATVRGDLSKLIGETVPEDMFGALLTKRRLLVIIDRLSGLSKATQDRVRPDLPRRPNMALIVTSRLEEILGNVSKGVIRPMRVSPTYLAEFINLYLREQNIREEFDDTEFFDVCRHIADLVGTREITVLLVKLYADQVIRRKRGNTGDKTLPRNIPNLMLEYVNTVNAAISEGRRAEPSVHADAKAVAHACVIQRLRPGPLPINEALLALEKIDREEAQARLDYLEGRLSLIETVTPTCDAVRFRLDPLAEYLAALQVREDLGGDEVLWKDFLARVESQEGAPESIREFLLAVRDTCLAWPEWLGLPEFVVPELERMAVLDPEVIEKARRSRRISRLLCDLYPSCFVDDRRHAIKVLASIQPVEQRVVSAIRQASKDDDAVVRRDAVQALGKLCVIGLTAEAVPALIAALGDTDEDVCRRAASVLGKIGPTTADAVPALIAALGNTDEHVRGRAASVLGQIGPAASEAVPVLIEVLRDADIDVRRSAAYALGKIGPAAAVPALSKAFGDTAVCTDAAIALGMIGPTAVPALIEALRHTNIFVRRGAAEALKMISPLAAEAIPVLIEALSDSDTRIRESAVEALGKLGPAAAEAVPALIDLLGDSDTRIRESASAVEALGKLGPAAAEAVPALIDLLGDSDHVVRMDVAKVLGQIGPAAAEAVPALIDLLRGSDTSSARGNAAEAAEALGKIGPAAVEAVPVLIDVLSDSDTIVRWRAAQAFGNLGPAATEAVPALIEALGDTDSEVRMCAAEALGKLAPAAAEAVPALIEALGNRNIFVRTKAAEVLGKVGPGAVEAVPALIEALDGRDYELRGCAADALGKIGPAAAEAMVPALIKYLSDSETVVRMFAAKVLGTIGPAAAEAVPALSEAIRDGDEVVRKNAALALECLKPR